MTLVLRFSRIGLAAAIVFLILAGGVFAWIFFVASKNPADSGESGVLLLPFALPWVFLAPEPWVGPVLGLISILFNAALLYLVCGGLRLAKK